jgi:hypothetical protein
MDSRVSETNIRSGIENTQIGHILRYKEIPWKYDDSNKKVLMYFVWNKEHDQYHQLRDRLDKGDNIKIVNDTVIWHVYIYKQVEEWRRGTLLK